MKTIQVKNFLQEKLTYLVEQSNYPKQECLHLIFRLLEYHFGIFQTDIVVNKKVQVSDSQMIRLDSDLQKIIQNEPIQYILGETEFYDLKIKVNENVLIPRPETEELVDLIIKENQARKQEFKILDIGTGSGCIALSLAKNLPLSDIFAMDISLKALNLAKENAQINQVKINFVEANILEISEDFFSDKFDMIVSNPPYVLDSEKAEMHANVLDFEPHLALFVENDKPLIFYEKITDFATKNLKQEGKLYFEINEKYGQTIKSMLKNKGFSEVKVIQDMQKKDRFVKGVL